jgi:hypothetical protein
MKKIVLLFVFFIAIVGNSQTTNKEWLSMVQNFQKSVDEVLISECPKGIELKEFRRLLLNGEIKLSTNSQEQMKEFSIPIRNYAKAFAKVNNIDTSDFSDAEFIFMGSFFYPEIKLDSNVILIDTTNTAQGKISASEVWNCLVDAVGIGGAGAIGIHALDAAGIRFLTKAVTKYLVRHAGWFGVGFTVADFGFCLYDASQN